MHKIFFLTKNFGISVYSTDHFSRTKSGVLIDEPQQSSGGAFVANDQTRSGIFNIEGNIASRQVAGSSDTLGSYSYWTHPEGLDMLAGSHPVAGGRAIFANSYMYRKHVYDQGGSAIINS